MKVTIAPKDEQFVSEAAYQVAYSVDLYMCTEHPSIMPSVSQSYKHILQDKFPHVEVIYLEDGKDALGYGCEIVRVIGTRKDIIDVAENLMIQMDYDYEFMQLVERAIVPIVASSKAPNRALFRYQENNR